MPKPNESPLEIRKDRIMKRVVCTSGIKGWQCRLQKNYADLEEFRKYAEAYGLLDRLGFTTAEEAWETNPVIEGSIIPEDFRLVRA